MTCSFQVFFYILVLCILPLSLYFSITILNYSESNGHTNGSYYGTIGFLGKLNETHGFRTTKTVKSEFDDVFIEDLEHIKEEKIKQDYEKKLKVFYDEEKQHIQMMKEEYEKKLKHYHDIYNSCQQNSTSTLNRNIKNETILHEEMRQYKEKLQEEYEHKIKSYLKEDQQRIERDTYQQLKDQFDKNITSHVSNKIHEEESIQENTQCNHIKTINFANSNWNNDAICAIHSVYENYTYQIPSFIPTIKSPRYSAIHTYYDNGIAWGYLYNTCYSLENDTILFYTHNKTKPATFRPKGFPASLKFQTIYNRIPSKTFDRSQGNWLFAPAVRFHCTHFMETSNFLLHAFMNPSNYPPIRHVYLPQFEKNRERGCNIEHLGIIMSIPPQGFKKDVLTREQLLIKYQPKNGIMCFRQLGINGGFHYVFRAGLFGSPLESDIYRAIAYKRFNTPISYEYEQTKKLNVLFIDREIKRKRNIQNLSDLRYYFKLNQNNCHFNEVFIENYTISEQVSIATKTDILVSVHGGAFAILVYMLPYSGIIELRPPYVRDNWYFFMSKATRLQHVPLTNLTAIIPPECKDVPVKWIGAPHYSECFKVIHYADVYIDMNIFAETYTSLYMTVVLNKYHYFK